MQVFVDGTLLQGMQRSLALRNAHSDGLVFINAEFYDCSAYLAYSPTNRSHMANCKRLMNRY